MPTVALTKAGIRKFADRLFTIGAQLDEKAALGGQAFLGEWNEFVNLSPFRDIDSRNNDNIGSPAGLFDLSRRIHSSFAYVINPQPDFRRLRRFEEKMQKFYDEGKAKGIPWDIPRPETSTAGGSGPPLTSSLTTLLLVAAGIYYLIENEKEG